MLKFSETSGGHLGLHNLRECFRALFDRFGIPHRPEELVLLAHKFVPDDRAEITGRDVARFCREESDRQEWSLVSRRLRSAAQKASIVGADLDSMISEYDTNGDHFISMVDFRGFLKALGQHGKISGKDITIASRRFAEAHRPDRGAERRDPISLADVLSFFGKAYVGNLEARLRKSIVGSISDSLQGGTHADEKLDGGERRGTDMQAGAHALQQALNTLDIEKSGEVRISDLESKFQSWSVYTDLSHEQVKKILTKLDASSRGKLFVAQFVKFVYGNDVVLAASSGNGNDSGRRGSQKLASEEAASMNAESLLRLLLERVQKHVAVDEVSLFIRFYCLFAFWFLVVVC